jgi:short-subunit dehydrogenase
MIVDLKGRTALITGAASGIGAAGGAGWPRPGSG